MVETYINSPEIFFVNTLKEREQMGKYFDYNIHDLIKVRTNFLVDDFLPSTFLVTGMSKPDIELYLKNSKVDTSGLIPLGIRLFYDENTFFHKCRFFLDTHLKIEDVDETTVIEFNRLYKLFRKPLYYFRAVLQMKLLDKGFSLIHSACVAKNGKGLMFSASSDTGKTTTALHFVIDSGYNLLGDDIVITDGKNILSFPLPVRKTTSKPFETIPLLRKLKKEKTISLPLEEEVTPEKIFFLVNGKKNEVNKVDKREIFRKMNLMTESACPLFPFPMGVMLGYYFVRNIDLKKYLERREKIMSRLINGCETWMAVAKESSMFYKLVKEAEKEN